MSEELYVVLIRKFIPEEPESQRWESVGYVGSESDAIKLSMSTATKAGYLDIVTYVSAEYIIEVSYRASVIFVSDGARVFKTVRNEYPKLSELEDYENSPYWYVSQCGDIYDSVIPIGRDIARLFEKKVRDPSVKMKINDAMLFVDDFYEGFLGSEESEEKVWSIIEEFGRPSKVDQYGSDHMALLITGDLAAMCLPGSNNRTCLMNMARTAWYDKDKGRLLDVASIIRKHIPIPMVLMLRK